MYPMKKFIVFAVVSLCSIGCFANSPNMGQELVSVTIHDSGHIIATLKGSANTENCATPGAQNAVLFRNDNPNYKLFYAMLLTALATGRSVDGWVNGCTDVWGNGGTRIVTGTTLNIVK